MPGVEPGVSLEGVAAFAWATERYIRETGDDQIVEEPVRLKSCFLRAYRKMMVRIPARS